MSVEASKSAIAHESAATGAPGGSAGASHWVSRRQFILLGAAALGAAWLGVATRAWLDPSAEATQSAAVVQFSLAELPVGGTKTFVYGGAPAMALRTAESVRAYSLVCTHLGCTVQWQGGLQEFYCPCHDGRFDQFGEVIAGPPPVPLEQLPVQVVGDTVVVGEA